MDVQKGDNDSIEKFEAKLRKIKSKIMDQEEKITKIKMYEEEIKKMEKMIDKL